MVEKLDKELRDKVAYGIERYPEYFGEYPVPQMTPLGPTTRFKRVKNGIFFVEAGTVWMLALSFPLSDDIGLDVIPLALVNDSDLTDAHNSAGPVFFRREHCDPAIFQLLFECHVDALGPFIRLDNMIAVLWERHKKIVEDYNAELDMLVESREELCLNFGVDLEEHIQTLCDRRIPPPTVPAEDFLILPK